MAELIRMALIEAGRPSLQSDFSNENMNKN